VRIPDGPTPVGRFIGALLGVLLILAAMGVAGWIEGGM
jgi:hypothetical protein